MKINHQKDDSFELWSLKQCVDVVFSHSLTANLGTFFIAPLVVLFLFKHIPANYLWWWCGSLLFMASIRIFLWYIYKRNIFSAAPETWSYFYTITCLLIGIVWALSAGFYYLISDSMVKAIVFMLHVGVIASAMIALTAIMRAFYSLVIPVFLGIFITLYLDDGAYSGYIGLGIFIYFAVICVAGVNTNRYILNSLKYQYDKKLMALDLRQEVEQRKKIQRALELHQVELESLVNKRTSQLQKTNSDLAKEVLIRKKAEEDLIHLAHHDDLTKLPNRLLLVANLEQAIKHAQRNDKVIAVLFIDLNGFKKINDTYGHSIGDQVLQTVANILTRTLREEDTIARIGGDEFIVVTEHDEIDDKSAILADKLIETLNEVHIINGMAFSFGCSIGISLYPRDGKDVDELLKNADAAMYQAKSDENKRYFFYAS